MFILRLSPTLRRYRGETPNKEAFDKHIVDLGPKLDVYDNILSKQNYLVGNVRHF